MNVEDVMTRSVHTCRASDTLHAAARGMWDRNVGAVVVTDADGRPLAVITDRDVCMAALTQGRALDALHVRSAMSHELYSCHRRDRVSAAERTMRTHRVRRLPVVDDDFRLVGIVTLSDLARARMALSNAAEARRLLAELAVTLSDISTPPGAPRPSQTYAPATAAAKRARGNRGRAQVSLSDPPGVRAR